MLPENCFVLTKDQVPTITDSSLFGYGLTDDAIILGSEGYREYARTSFRPQIPREGRFVGLFIDDQKLLVRADATGQEILYLYRSGNDWAISNSFLTLAETASKRDKLDIHTPSVIGFHLKNGVHIGEQLISHRTIIDKIEVVPINCELLIDRHDGGISTNSAAYLSIFDYVGGATYEETLIDIIERGCGILSAMSDAGYRQNLFLSGGYDSRLVLGMLVTAGRTEQLRVTSMPQKENDFRVAQSLCGLFGLKLNVGGPKKPATMSASDVVRLYLMSCGGTYLPFYPVQHYRLSTEAELRLTGDQPTGWSHFAGNARFNGNAAKIANDIILDLSKRGGGDLVREEFLSTFDVLQIESDHPAAMLAYYNAIRGRFHCGRNWYKSLGNQFLFTPLMQSAFVALDLHNSKQGFHPTKFFVDAFSAIGDWALREPFETPERAFSPELLDLSPFKGGVSITPRTYRVYGQIGNNSTLEVPDIYSLPLDVDANEESIKDLISTIFYRARHSKESDLFNAEDFAKANGEIHARSSLSHGYRKVCHIVSTDIALKLTERSKAGSKPSVPCSAP
jgi:hypothetical protein